MKPNPNKMSKLFIFPILCLFIFSCTSDDTSDDAIVLDPEEEVNFFGLEIGNKWEYHYYKRQGSGENVDYVFDNVTSTHEVIGISEIEGIEYFEIEVNANGVCAGCPSEGLSSQFLRLDNENLVDEDGNILFFIGDTIGDEIIINNYGNIDVVLSFDGDSQFESNYGIYDETVLNTIFAVNNDDGPDYNGLGLDVYHYAKGIGLVYRTISGLSSPLPSTKQYLVEFTTN